MIQGTDTNRAAGIGRPIGDALRFTEGRHVAVLAGVAFVLRFCDPAAILRCVVTVVVDAINLFRSGVARTLRPCGVVSERPPRFADTNPTPAVTTIALMVLVSAALVHSIPAAIEMCPVAWPIVSVDGGNAGLILATFTATRTRIRQQLERADVALGSAVAATRIQRWIVGAATFTEFAMHNRPDDQPSAEPLTDLDFQRLHGGESNTEDAEGNRHVA